MELRTFLQKSGRTFCRLAENKRNIFIFENSKQIRNFQVVLPWKTSPSSIVPGHILKPLYAESGVARKSPPNPEKLLPNKVEALKRTCKLAANILKSLESFVKVGVTTESIDQEVHRLSIMNDAYPSPLNYQLYPKSCCTSVNNVACHGIPDGRPLASGDIVNVDVTVFRETVHGDCSTMFLIGEVDDQGKKICSVAKEALNEAITICKPGTPISYIGNVIEDYVKSHNLTVIPCFTGHGIGTYFHGPPDIYHFRCKKAGKDTMEEGMCFTIEPVVGDGEQDIIILEDMWTAITADDSRTAQYEHTIRITKDGAEVLTVSDPSEHFIF